MVPIRESRHLGRDLSYVLLMKVVQLQKREKHLESAELPMQFGRLQRDGGNELLLPCSLEDPSNPLIIFVVLFIYLFFFV